MAVGAGHQAAPVVVGGECVGVWNVYDGSYQDTDSRREDGVFAIPIGHMAGKTNLSVTLEISPESDAWTEYRYAVFAVRPFIEGGDIDDDEMADKWEVEFFGSVNQCVADEDVDTDGLSNLEQFICQTAPHNHASLFAISNDIDSVYCNTSSSRVYCLMKNTNLVNGIWLEVDSISGYEGGAIFPFDRDGCSNGFYRVEVGL